MQNDSIKPFVKGEKIKCINSCGAFHKGRIYTFQLYLYDNHRCGIYTVEGPNTWSGENGSNFIPATLQEIEEDYLDRFIAIREARNVAINISNMRHESA